MQTIMPHSREVGAMVMPLSPDQVVIRAAEWVTDSGVSTCSSVPRSA